MGVFLQAIILLIVMSCMVMVLLAIRQLAHFDSYDNTEETGQLRKEIKEDEHILSKNNVFSSIVEAEPVIKEDDYKSNSKEP